VTTRLNDRTLGWLRFLWDKATTIDDWSDEGEPHPWWDRYTEPPMCSFPRFDVAEMGYVLPMMLESTPAWREVYERILDELVWRYLSFWGPVDWNTLIGPDPGVDRYPPDWMVLAPEGLRGRYALPGWTGNGVEPWGLQPDPIGCDGNVFYRGWLNLLLGIREYVSGRRTPGEPFSVSGYRNRTFTWTHERTARFISAQMASRPQGPHCENTKIWPFCVSAAGLGLRLYDTVFGTTLHTPSLDWIAFLKKHYMSTRRGELEWFALYYDPIEGRVLAPPGPTSAYAAIAVLHYLFPQDPDFAADLYAMAMRRLRWNDRSVPLIQLLDDPQLLSTALWTAREVGDDVTAARLREITENTWSPRYFGDEDTRFGFWTTADEQWPRGQLNATMMMTECAPPGAWSRVFDRPSTYHDEPTVVGVDYPLLGLRRAENICATGELHIESFTATPSARGRPTAFRVDRLPHDRVRVVVDGSAHPGVRVLSAGCVEIPVDIGDHVITVHYG
jgi:hypothetical protein